MVAEPAAAVADADTVSVAEPPAVTEVGLRVTLTPAGAPVADSATDCAVPPTTDVDTVAVVAEPAVTVPEAGFSDRPKSADPPPAGVNVHWLALPEQLPGTMFVPDTRTHFWPVWMSEIVPFGFTDHCWDGPPLHLARTTLLPDMAAHKLWIIRNAPSNVNRWLVAALLQAAVLSWTPVLELSPGSSRHWPFEPFLYWPTVMLGCAPP